MAIGALGLVLISCDGASSGGGNGPAACAVTARAIVATSDYSSSEISVLNASQILEAPVTGVDLGGDPVLSVSSGRCFYVARDHDLLIELDPMCGTPLNELRLSTSSVSENPQDVAATADGTLFVPKFQTGDLVVRTPDGELSAIHLASFDPDGNPQPSSATTVSVGGVEKIFVTLERLVDATLLPGALPSMVVRVDPKSRAVDAQVDLIGQDPFGLAASYDGALFFAEPGHFNDAAETNAGIERLDPATMTTTLLVREKDLGGSVTEVALMDGCAAAIVADPTSVNATAIVTFDPITGNIHIPAASSPLATSGYDLEGITFIGGNLYVGDRRRAAGGYPIHTFTVGASCALSPNPDSLFVPQQPVAIRSPR